MKVSKGESLEKLERSFDEHGFIKPIVCWWNSTTDEKTDEMLDGHQRRKLIYRMATKGKGTKDLLIPIVYSKAPTKEQAMKILLHLVEQTGDITQDGLLAFSQKHSLSLDDIANNMSLKSPALAAAQKKLEEKKVQELQADPQYPIQAHFSEKYGCVTIFYKNELDKLWLDNLLKLPKTKDYNSSFIGPTTVIDVEHVQKVIQDLEDSLRPKKDKKDASK